MAGCVSHHRTACAPVCCRMLGVKMGTGGSSGYYYLKASAEVCALLTACGDVCCAQGLCLSSVHGGSLLFRAPFVSQRHQIFQDLLNLSTFLVPKYGLHDCGALTTPSPFCTTRLPPVSSSRIGMVLTVTGGVVTPLYDGRSLCFARWVFLSPTRCVTGSRCPSCPTTSSTPCGRSTRSSGKQPRVHRQRRRQWRCQCRLPHPLPLPCPLQLLLLLQWTCQRDTRRCQAAPSARSGMVSECVSCHLKYKARATAFPVCTTAWCSPCANDACAKQLSRQLPTRCTVKGRVLNPSRVATSR